MSEADIRLAAEVIQARAAGRHLLLLTDFDGTLCEFHTDPDAVWLAPSRRALLEEIASDPRATLAIVSGRRLEDVRQRTMLGPDTYYAGLHGLEIEGGGDRYRHPAFDRSEALLRSLARSLVLHEGITTTVAKAKELRPFVERLVTYGKKNTLASRRLAVSKLGDKAAVKKLFDAIAPRYEGRAGGYTRVVKRAARGSNDARKLAYIMFV